MAPLIAYALFLLYAIVRLFRRPAQGEVDYILMGRRLTLPAFVATLVATWYGGILGVGEYSWRYGISNWLVFGVPYYLYAALFALFIAPRARRSPSLTIPDQLDARYGHRAALAGAAVLFVMTAPAAYVLMLGVLARLVTGWPLWAGVALGTALSVGYVFRGGFRAVVGTDMIQFGLMFLAFLVLTPACVAHWGGLDFLRAALPPAHLTWDGGRGAQAVAVWYFIAMATLVEPAFYQRCYAARDARTAQAGIALSLLFWIVFDALTTTAGLYARAVLPDLADPLAAYPELAARTLSPVWQGVFTVGLLATIMSTVDSYSLLAAVTVGRDIIARRRARRAGRTLAAGQDPPLRAIRWSLLATALLAAGLALWSGSVIRLWHHLGSVGTPVLLLPLALSHTGVRLSERTVLGAMLTAGVVSLGWLAAGRGQPLLGIEPIFPGLAVSALWLGPAAWRGRPGGRPAPPASAAAG